MALEMNLNELSLENVGAWPYPVKVVACVLLSALIIVLAYLVDTKSQFDSLDGYKRQERVLRHAFEKKYFQAARIDEYKNQLAEMRNSLGTMLRELPSRTEVPGLLEDISKSGRSSGLEFKLFDPQDEIQHDFYAELPIQITVDGDYHQFGDFVSRISALGRIVTLHDLEIKLEEPKKPMDTKNNEPTKVSELEMTMTAKTYRYSEDEKKDGKNKELAKNSK